MWMALGIGVVGLVGIIGLLLWGACAVAGRSDDEVEAAREREAAKRAVDVMWWSLMADAALDAAREGEC